MTARQELLGQLKEKAKAKGISQADIAKTIRLKPSNVSRILNGKHACTIDKLMRVADACDMKIVFVDMTADEIGARLHRKIEAELNEF